MRFAALHGQCRTVRCAPIAPGRGIFVQQEVLMRMRNLAAAVALLPVLLLAGCGNDTGMVAAAPAAHKATRAAATDDAIGSDDPVLNAYYAYRVALDVMMRSGGGKTTQLEPVMTPK